MNCQHTLEKECAPIPEEVPILIYLLQLEGGAGKIAVKYANHLAGRGYVVQLLCGNAPSKKLLEALSPEVELVISPVSKSLCMPLHLVKAFRKLGPGLVVVMGASNFLPISIARTMAGNKSVMLLRETNSPSGLIQSYGFWKRIFKRQVFALAYKRADHVIAISRVMQQELEQDWCIPSDRISVIYNGVTLPDRIEPGSADMTFPTILCAARLAPQKDIPTLLRAFAIVIRLFPCKLLIAGSGSERSRLVDLSSRLGIADNVEFLGQVADLEPLYRNAAVTVLSSRFEGFGNVLVESLAYGCPIVATDCPTGPSEIISGPDVGLLAEVGNADDLAAKLLTSLNTDYDPKCLLERAAYFSEANMAAELDAVVTRLLNKPGSFEDHRNFS